MKNSMQAKWYIHHFADYHEIEDTEDYKAIELGCFPPKNDRSFRGGCYRYFGLYYKGRKPAFAKVFDAILSKINLDGFGFTLEEHLTKEEAKEEVRESVKLALKPQKC